MDMIYHPEGGISTEALCERFVAEARWLLEFVAKKKSVLNGSPLPTSLFRGQWEGEPEFNTHFETFRGLHFALWERGGDDPDAKRVARQVPIFPYSEIKLHETCICLTTLVEAYAASNPQ